MGLLFMQLLNHTDRLVYESREDRAIMEIFRYIEENYKNGSLTEAAELLHYDFYWLSHEIKNRTGKTYTEHLQEKRLSQAAFLLKSSSLSVEEIALAVGYENKSYFHRIFSAKYSTSPKKYRNS
jgi:AraC-like DNA-binding protein